LTGSLGVHQQRMIAHQLNHITFLNQEIMQLDADIKKTEFAGQHASRNLPYPEAKAAFR
jgi:hypothetical protein